MGRLLCPFNIKQTHIHTTQAQAQAHVEAIEQIKRFDSYFPFILVLFAASKHMRTEDTKRIQKKSLRRIINKQYRIFGIGIRRNCVVDEEISGL